VLAAANAADPSVLAVAIQWARRTPRTAVA
jgi:hypothetical protein